MHWRLAYKELTFDRMMSICQIAAIASIIAPLLLLFSLRYGILEELKNNLMNDPKVLSLTLDTSYHLNENFFNQLQNNKHVGFVIPEITALNAIVDIKFPGGVKRVEVIPTKVGDPIVVGSSISYHTEEQALKNDEVFINESFAFQRDIRVGDQINVVVSRTQQGRRQASTLKMTVKGIINQRFVNDDCILVNMKVLDAIDYYRNGYDPALLTSGNYENDAERIYAKFRLYAKSLDDVTPLYYDLVEKRLNVTSKMRDIENVKAENDAERIYAKFRLYAKSLDDVTPLYYDLVEKRLNVTSKMRDIENVKAIGSVLNFVFGVVASVSIVGGIIALAGLILSSLKARKRNIVLLRLMGQTYNDIYLIVIIESLIVATIGFVLAFMLYYLGSWVFNYYFESILVGSVVSKLTLLHIAGFLLGTFLLSALVALIAAKFVILKVNISDVLRQA